MASRVAGRPGGRRTSWLSWPTFLLFGGTRVPPPTPVDRYFSGSMRVLPADAVVTFFTYRDDGYQPAASAFDRRPEAGHTPSPRSPF